MPQLVLLLKAIIYGLHKEKGLFCFVSLRIIFLLCWWSMCKFIPSRRHSSRLCELAPCRQHLIWNIIHLQNSCHRYLPVLNLAAKLGKNHFKSCLWTCREFSAMICLHPSLYFSGLLSQQNHYKAKYFGTYRSKLVLTAKLHGRGIHLTHFSSGFQIWYYEHIFFTVVIMMLQSFFWVKQNEIQAVRKIRNYHFVYNGDHQHFCIFMLGEKQILWVFRKMVELFLKPKDIKARTLEIQIELPWDMCCQPSGVCMSKPFCSRSRLRLFWGLVWGCPFPQNELFVKILFIYILLCETLRSVALYYLHISTSNSYPAVYLGASQSLGNDTTFAIPKVHLMPLNSTIT